MRSVSILVTWLCLLAATSALADVHLFLGFMNDEANEVLRTVIENSRGTPVVAIQAGRSNGTFFGKPHRSYSALSPEVFFTDKVVPASDLTSRIASTLHDRLGEPAFTAQVQSAYVTGEARTVHEGHADPVLSVISYGPTDPSAKDVIVVALAPEMGRQPGLVTPYLAELMKALKSLPQARKENGGLHVSVIATSGGVHHKTRPGRLSDVGASLFIGCEPSRQGYDGVVAFEDGTGVTSELFRKHFATREEAEKAASHEFLEKGGNLVVPASGLGLAELITKARAHGRDVSLTASFFIGPEIKEKGDALKVTNANMEDYHILKAAPLADSVRILRLITDPPHIPESLRDRIVNWSREPHFTVAKYEDAILWGLRGSPLDKVPDTARWTALEGASPKDIEGFLAPLPGKDPSFVLSPFYAEIASEFLNELARGTAFNAGPESGPSAKGIISRATTDLLSEAALEELDRLVAKKSRELSALAHTVLEVANADAPEGVLRERIRALVEATCFLDVPRESLLYRELSVKVKERAKLDLLTRHGKLRFLAREYHLNDEGRAFPMETWVVNGRWDGNSGRHVRYLGKEGINEVQQDRAFYRSGLLTLSRPAARREALMELARVTKLKATCIDELCRLLKEKDSAKAGLPK